MGRFPKFRGLRLLRAAWPLVAAEAAYSVIYLTDAAMVSPLGTNHLAALGSALAVLWMIAHFGIGYMATVNTLVAQCLSKKRRRHCGMYAWQGIWTAFGCGVLVLLIFLPAAPWIFSLYGHEPAVFALEVPYFQISILAVAPEMGAMALSAYFVAVGKPARALLGAIIAALTNLLFDYVLIWGHFGFPELGITGSGWATLIASSSHFAFLFVGFVFTRDRRFATRNPRIDLRGIATLGEIGLPAGLQGAVEYLSWGVVLIGFIGVFETVDLAAGGILISIAQAAYLPADGIGTHVLAQVASAIGKKRHRLTLIRARHGFRLIGGYLACTAVVLVVFRSEIMHALSEDPEVILIGSRALLVVAFILVADSVGITLLHCLQGAGDTVWPATASIFSSVVVLVGGGYAVIYLAPQWGSLGIWWVAAAYITCQSGLYYLRWRSRAWMHPLFH